jgi:hypothetical protein
MEASAVRPRTDADVGPSRVVGLVAGLRDPGWTYMEFSGLKETENGKNGV